uniref:Uncharacterized protein n=1 Tax=Eutreptiella gymnastica TaxID=73025 RepID=A0A7S1IHY4_9EUGL
MINHMGRMAAFNVCMLMWLFCGLVICCIGFTLFHDERQMQIALAALGGQEMVPPAEASTRTLIADVEEQVAPGTQQLDEVPLFVTVQDEVHYD